MCVQDVALQLIWFSGGYCGAATWLLDCSD